jgi:hypothetical protein
MMYKFKTTNLREGNLDVPKITQTFTNFNDAQKFLKSFSKVEAKNRNCFYEREYTNQYFPLILFGKNKCTFVGRKNKGAPTYSDEIPIWKVEIVKNES